MPPGPYLVLPFLGPSSVRDAPAKVADEVLQPLFWYNPNNVNWISLGVNVVDERARLLPLDKTLAQTFDPYAFVRDAFLQRRRYLVYDGNPPEEPLEEEFKDDSGQ